MTKRILFVFGTRPEAIKLAPVIKEIEKFPELKGIVCITAQHRKMLDQVLKTFEIVPHYDLNIMVEGQNLFDIAIKSLDGLKDVLAHVKPDLVLVQGDTTTAFIASLAAYYLKIPIGHIEAGLRTYNKYSPFPEEINRRLLSVLADYHFAPTSWAKSNLLKEGVLEEKIWITGNTVIDALLMIHSWLKTEGSRQRWKNYFKNTWNLELSFEIEKSKPKVLLVTGHRRENFGVGFKNICMALKEIAEKRNDVEIVYPVHLNPNVQQPVKSLLSGIANIHLIDPLEYEPFVFLMNTSYLVLTDSGGIQEEAPFLGKPVLVMRETTERPEGITAGTVKLAGTQKDRIVKETLSLFDNAELYQKMSQATNPYGDGKAAGRIIRIILGKDGKPV
ncbi:MAG: UDP-N-acetylglucosamine 2-epimerase (non-hydrolyzing) [Candidatus Brocadiaceae bacterium]